MLSKTEVVQAIKAMASDGKSRDDVMMWMFQNGVKPSAMNGFIKSAVVTFGRVGSGWRQATAKYFAEDTEHSYEAWKVIMQNDGDNLLSDNNIAAYTNHFKLWQHIKNGEVM